MTFNGWINYETWCVYCWLTNDLHDVCLIRDFIRNNPNKDALITHDLKEYLVGLYRDELNPLVDEANMYSDLLMSALQEVDWFHIAEVFIKENL